MRHKAMNFIRKIVSFKPELANLLIVWGYGSWQQMQKFSLISLKLCLLSPKPLDINCEYHYSSHTEKSKKDR